jgi:hypothetical protein
LLLRSDRVFGCALSLLVGHDAPDLRLLGLTFSATMLLQGD